MAASEEWTQKHFYPCQQEPEDLCIICDAGLISEDGPDGTDGSNGSKGSPATSGSPPEGTYPPYVCADWCDAECNNLCEENQAYCYIEHQYIKDHGDVGGYNGSTSITSEDYIHKVWTADYWNTLINKLEVAGKVGFKGPMGSGPAVTANIGYPHFQTASLYNQVEAKLSHFNASYDKVSVNDLITATLANAIGFAYNVATFSYSVCDVCDATGSQSLQQCSCNCPTCSACPECSACPSCTTCPSCSCYCAGCYGCTSCSSPPPPTPPSSGGGGS